MKMLFVGPTENDDPAVHAIAKHRTQLAGGRPPVTDGDRLYAQFLQSTANHISPIDEVALVFAGLQTRAEVNLLDGAWSGICEYHESYLPGLRYQLARAWAGDATVVHIDMGDSLSTLYAAYFAVIVGLPTSVTFHVPEDPEKSFAVGGHSIYAQFKPLLRRTLGKTVLGGAQGVHVSAEGLAGALASLFPKLPIKYRGDPLTVVLSDPAAPDLSSATAGG